MTTHRLRALYIGLTGPDGRELSYRGYARAKAENPEVLMDWDDDTGRIGLSIGFPHAVEFAAPYEAVEVEGFIISTMPMLGHTLYQDKLTSPKAVKAHSNPVFHTGNVRIHLFTSDIKETEHERSGHG